MQCVGTLSWSGMGLAWPDKHRRDESPSPRTAAPTRRPDFNVRQSDTGAPSPRQIPGGNPIAKGRVQASSDLAPATLPKHAEAASLEIDWSQIVRRCLDGDSSAWAELVRAQHRRVYGLCYRFTGNPTDAEDLTQDVFLKIYSNLASFDTGRGSLHVWIAAMTRNLLVDNFRRTKNLRATSSLDDGWESAEELKPIDRLTARGVSPHEAAAKKELAKMVQEALSRVSVELREAVILRDLQDLDYKEIACVLEIPEGTVKSRISRGRAELARLLERNRREVM